MDFRYQRNIYQIVHKYHQIVHKFTDGRTEYREERRTKSNLIFERQKRERKQSGAPGTAVPQRAEGPAGRLAWPLAQPWRRPVQLRASAAGRPAGPWLCPPVGWAWPQAQPRRKEPQPLGAGGGGRRRRRSCRRGRREGRCGAVRRDGLGRVVMGQGSHHQEVVRGRRIAGEAPIVRDPGGRVGRGRQWSWAAAAVDSGAEAGSRTPTARVRVPPLSPRRDDERVRQSEREEEEQTERWGHGRRALSTSGRGQIRPYRKANSTHTPANRLKQLKDV